MMPLDPALQSPTTLPLIPENHDITMTEALHLFACSLASRLQGTENELLSEDDSFLASEVLLIISGASEAERGQLCSRESAYAEDLCLRSDENLTPYKPAEVAARFAGCLHRALFVSELTANEIAAMQLAKKDGYQIILVQIESAEDSANSRMDMGIFALGALRADFVVFLRRGEKGHLQCQFVGIGAIASKF